MARRKNPESEVRKAIVDMLLKHDRLVIRANSGAHKTPQQKRFIWFVMWFFQGKWKYAGVSDVIAIGRTGRFIAIEVKVDATKKPREMQQHFLTEVEATNGIAIVGYSADQVKAILENEGEL
ncbi:MAG: hypothetical protein OEX12_01260 [Gammaproteobacteria bacterium]|nr:hypothetical protein [Gammaproteobacteria bacterium]